MKTGKDRELKNTCASYPIYGSGMEGASVKLDFFKKLEKFKPSLLLPNS
jgi:hypothetical protein